MGMLNLQYVSKTSISSGWIALALLSESVLLWAIVTFVPYTEIDWKAYMQEVEPVLVRGELNYTLLKGDTGPLVYPGFFVWVYGILYEVTEKGKDIRFAQWIFGGIYLLLIYCVIWLYRRSHALSLITLGVLCASRRIHSIFVLRLFNDGIAMLLLYASMVCVVLAVESGGEASENNTTTMHVEKAKEKTRKKKKTQKKKEITTTESDVWWSRMESRVWMFVGCSLFSLGVGVKMNILLFAPALLVVLLKHGGVLYTAFYLFVCALLQVLVGLPFLLFDYRSYISKSFELGRVFTQVWSVNYKGLPEWLFVSKELSLALLLCHGFLVCFAMSVWWRQWGRDGDVGARQVVHMFFCSNFIGMVFARSLHFQFYVWYYHTLIWLVWETRWPKWVGVGWCIGVELVWNVYPTRMETGVFLHVCHLCLLLSMPLWPKVRKIKQE